MYNRMQLYMHMCMFQCVGPCACVSLYKYTGIHISLHMSLSIYIHTYACVYTYLYTYMYIYIYIICAKICVCVGLNMFHVVRVPVRNQAPKTLQGTDFWDRIL